MIEADGMDDRVRIVFPERGAGGLGVGTRIFTGTGEQVQYVRSIEISPILPDDLITAKIELHLDLCDLWAHPLLGMDTLKRAALSHGMQLVPIEAAASDATGGRSTLGVEIADEEAIGSIVHRIALECHDFALSRGITGKPVESYLGLVFGVLERNAGDLIRAVPVAARSASDIGAIRFEFCPEGYRRVADAAIDAVAATLD